MVEDDVQQQQENIFHTHCVVNDRLYNIVIDGGSCINVANKVLVDKLNFSTMKHPNPYAM